MPTCPVCGTPFDLPARPRGGRPQEYCSQPCREVSSLMNRLDTLVPVVALRAKAGGDLRLLAMLRGNLFRLANLCNVVGRPVQGLSPIRNRKRSGWKGLEPSR